jgi:RNA polymerase sigma-70 factor (ECF subfamily)
VVVSSREIGAEIIESCRRGDREAFRALYEAYKDKVYSIALYFFHGDGAAASDVTQQVFMKLMTSIAHFRGDSGFSTWLYRLVVNACVDGRRRAQSHALVTDPAVLDALVEPASHEDQLAQAQSACAIQTAISTLPPKYRLAILLRYFEDLSYEEIAEALNCSIGTVASRLNRGHRLLAERLAPLRGSVGPKA